MPSAKNELYIDFEGDLKYSVYLIGVVLKNKDELTKHIFWSDKTNDKKLFTDFFNFIFSLGNDYVIFHYGSYEMKAIFKANELFSIITDEKLSLIQEKSVNILDYFYADIFPPTYSNGLKEIAQFLGFQWTKSNANGLLVTYWRTDWLEHRKEKTKRKIITYNLEDCLALLKINDWLIQVSEEKKEVNNVVFDTRNYLKSKSSLKYKKNNFLVEEFNEVNDLAYFNYQREKVIVRDKEFTRKHAPKRFKVKVTDKITSHEHPPRPLYCEKCGSLKVYLRETRKRKIIDIKIYSNGIKKNCILFYSKRYKCEDCNHSFTPTKYASKPKYGFNLKIWVINQIICYRVSFASISNQLLDYFKINLNKTTISSFRKELSESFQPLKKELKQNLISGDLIQTDETKIRLQNEEGYIWVITNLNTVLYFYQPNREGEFIQELLKGFKGVLVSDFYAAYDSIDCPQQKCLVHLIRDINNDLFQNQMNADLQYLAKSFGVLIKKIVATIDKYGLKKRNLNKHKKDVSKFYKDLKAKELNTEIGKKWLKRLVKNEEKLFTFLNYDGVPWNNNNAEHAIKTFALYRREKDGKHSKKGINEFLVLLSISETCKFRGISFWEFLKSRSMEL